MMSWIGGKSHIGKWIKTFVPTDVETFCEPFSGMFWVYLNLDLAKFHKLRRVVYNDYNGLNSNLWACIRRPHEFYEHLKKVPAQQPIGKNDKLKALFNEWQPQVFCPEHEFGKLKVDPDNPDFGLATKYAFIVTQCFSGAKPETGSFVDTGHSKSKFQTFREKLNSGEYQRHIDKITHIRNLDFADVIKEFDDPSTYYYIDAPYYSTEDLYSNHNFTAESHQRLAKSAKSCQARWSMSYYDFQQLKEMYPPDQFHWERKLFVKNAAATSGKANKKNTGEEILIMNYTPGGKSKLGDFFTV